MTDDTQRTSDPERFYRRRPPLWQPRPTRNSYLLASLGVVGAALLVAVVAVPNVDLFLLSSPPVRVQAVVTSVVSGVPSDEMPGFYRYVARLESGREIRFEAPELYRPGTRVEGMLSRGRITGRMRFTGPGRIVPGPK